METFISYVNLCFGYYISPYFDAHVWWVRLQGKPSTAFFVKVFLVFLSFIFLKLILFEHILFVTPSLTHTHTLVVFPFSLC